MYSFRKSKVGFTLIELMVVVAIIGVLSLLGLRLYTGQQEKAKNAIVKANAGTVQTLIQGDLADTPALTAAQAVTRGIAANLRNPYNSTSVSVIIATSATATVTGNVGRVGVIGTGTGGTQPFSIIGYGAGGVVISEVLTARL